MDDYFIDSEIKQIELATEGFWVKVKTKLKYGDIKNFLNIGKDGLVSGSASLDEFLRHAITEWNLTEKGQVAPIDQEHIDKIDQDDIEKIVNTAGASIVGDKKEDADFLGKSEASSTPAQ